MSWADHCCKFLCNLDRLLLLHLLAVKGLRLLIQVSSPCLLTPWETGCKSGYACGVQPFVMNVLDIVK